MIISRCVSIIDATWGLDDSGSALCKQRPNSEPGCWQGSRICCCCQMTTNHFVTQSFHQTFCFYQCQHQLAVKRKKNKRNIWIFFAVSLFCSMLTMLQKTLLFMRTWCNNFWCTSYDKICKYFSIFILLFLCILKYFSSSTNDLLILDV